MRGLRALLRFDDRGREAQLAESSHRGPLVGRFVHRRRAIVFSTGRRSRAAGHRVGPCEACVTKFDVDNGPVGGGPPPGAATEDMYRRRPTLVELIEGVPHKRGNGLADIGWRGYVVWQRNVANRFASPHTRRQFGDVLCRHAPPAIRLNG
jgi:hypothetical protein